MSLLLLSLTLFTLTLLLAEASDVDTADIAVRNLRSQGAHVHGRYLFWLGAFGDPKSVNIKQAETNVFKTDETANEGGISAATSATATKTAPLSNKDASLAGYRLAAYEATKNDGAQLSDRHIIFTIFQPGTGASSDYKLHYPVIEAIIESTVNILSPGWRVHVLVGDDKSIEILTPRPGLQVVDYRTAPPSERLEKFKDTYVSQTINDLSFENFCMRRWILIADYLDFLSMNGVPLNHIFTLDSDVVLIKDPLLVDKSLDWKAIQSYRVINGAAVFWSLHGINSFVHFMVDSYSSREKAAVLVKKYGKTVKGCGRGEHVALIPCFTPKGESDLHMLHMTDMFWYSAWADLNPASRVKKSPGTMDCVVINRLGDKNFNFIHKGSDVFEDKQGTKEPYCIIHFQGEHKKHVLPFLSFVHDTTSSFYLEQANDKKVEGDNWDLEGYPMAAYESMVNDGTNPSGRHIIFTIFQPDNAATSDYKLNCTLIEAIVDSTIKLLFPEWRVHVLLNVDELIEILSPRQGLTVVDYRRAPPSERLQKFDTSYVSQTVNDLAFEQFCILRWNLIADYLNYLNVNGVPVNQIVTLDSDVVLIKDPLLVDKSVDWSMLETYSIINGAAVSWSLQGMNNFVDFMVDSYSSKEKATELVRTHGKTFKACLGDDHATLIPCFIPEGESELHMLHMSDMHWYNTWVGMRPISRIQKPLHSMDCLVVGELGRKNFNFIHKGSDVVEENAQNEGAYCLVHFQGDYKKYVLPFLSFVHGELSSYYLNTALDLLYAKPINMRLDGDNAVLEGYPLAASQAIQNDGAHLSGRHVVFTFYQPKKEQPIDYTTIEAIVDSTVKLLFPYWRVHVLVGDDKTIEILTPRRGLQVVDYRRAPPSGRLRRFDATYVSQTINPISFENYCMRRWILVADYLNYLGVIGVPVSHIITLNDDVVLIKDPLLVDKSVDWTGIESYSIINGAAVSWSLQGINKFVDVLLDSYSSREKTAELVIKYGKTVKGCAEGDHVALIPCFTPEGEEDLHMMHMSDMHWYNMWVDQNPSLRIQKPLGGMDCIVVGGLGDKNYNFIHKGTDIVEEKAQSEGAYCMVYFQGEYKKYIVSFLSFVHGEYASYYLDTSLELLYAKQDITKVEQKKITNEEIALSELGKYNGGGSSVVGRHVVFAIFQPENGSISGYNINYTLIEAIVDSTLNLLYPAWNVHVLANDDKIIEKLIPRSGLQIVDYRRVPPSKRLQQFDTTYVSQTVNPVLFENFCMRRWILIADYLNHLSENGVLVNQIFTLDTDVVLIKDPFLLNKSLDWTAIDSYSVINGAAVSWNLQGMNKFVAFLLDSYSSRENAASLAKKYGKVVNVCEKGDHVALIPCFIPEGKKDLHMMHMSDMHWYHSWVDQNPSLRIKKSDEAIDCIIVDGLGDKNFKFVHKGSEIVEDSAQNEGTYCMVHFQGLYKKYIMSFLAFIHGEVPSYYLDTAEELLYVKADKVKVDDHNSVLEGYGLAASKAKMNDGVHLLSGRHVVFSIFQSESVTDSDWKLNHTLINAIIDSTVKLLYPDWRVHVLVNDDKIIDMLTPRRGLLVVDYRKAPQSERLDKFDASYVSQTINPISFERFCMRRWILIADYLDYLTKNGVTVNQIVTLDNDVVLIKDPLLVDKSVDWTDIESYSIISGASVSWSLQGINSFADFLLHSYSSREKAAELVTKYGKTVKGCAEGDHIALTPCFIPEGENGLHMVHMSDMHWYNAWSDEKSASRIRKSPENFDCIVVGGLGSKTFDFLYKGSDVVDDGTQNAKAYCMVHFQGLYKKYIMSFLSFVHGEVSSYHLDTSIALL
eukprot:CAMPEP_0172417388 /NCGR_PEP_ID=MMETSP1064-20121228/3911_1 /TAXON_ID=202472 /ORGANISM="Aulacoseira subarctica , Strain CCAP 1002/5" /LENGTH=1817 /DNA_ID=CAMNT_0013155689 /DNA_START=55 /DNA_END=5505 /DNA_ORIENTATION=-